jgi:hypothetical protein
VEDWQKDQWVKSNLPDDPKAVKILMRLAYDEGRQRERQIVEDSKRGPVGPYDID